MAGGLVLMEFVGKTVILIVIDAVTVEAGGMKIHPVGIHAVSMYG